MTECALREEAAGLAVLIDEAVGGEAREQPMHRGLAEARHAHDVGHPEAVGRCGRKSLEHGGGTRDALVKARQPRLARAPLDGRPFGVALSAHGLPDV